MSELVLTRDAKRELAQRIVTEVADMIGREYGADVEIEMAAKRVAAQWLARLPGDGWDVRLPQPQRTQ